ncbi:hypothetical protein AB0L05_14505 [Nonomuraea pusilla]|uniref:hypothetical protein n=1 Tax=Nonomuraea pusilla TaxID=46177 RepID=UPI00332C2B87
MTVTLLPPSPSTLRPQSHSSKIDDKAYREDIQLIRDPVEAVIKELHQGRISGEADLLGLMLEAADPETGRPSQPGARERLLPPGDQQWRTGPARDPLSASLSHHGRSCRQAPPANH